ncbi:MAG: flippase-like domain-containing protein [Chloroflexi bacterium]|nr:flippase-like domain-containing protein [Chloroflexota bacterium]
MKDRLANLIKLLISAGLLFVLFRTLDVRQSWEALRNIHLGFFAGAVFLFALTQVIRAFRWRVLLTAVDVHVPAWRLIYLYTVGTFFNTFLPSGFGGDAIKMYELNRYSRRGSESVSTVLLDRWIGLVALFVLGLIALPLVYAELPQPEAAILAIVCVLGLLASWLIFQKRLVERLLGLLPGRLRPKMLSFYQAVHTAGTGALWKALGISMLFSVVLFVLNYFLALAVGIHVSFVYVIAFMPLLSLSMTVPSIGALGTREGAYVLLFGAAGVPEPLALAMSLAFYAVNVLIGIIGGLLYVGGAAMGLRRAPRSRKEGQGVEND